MNLIRQLGSFLRYKKIGQDHATLAELSRLPLEKINDIDTYSPQISADTVLRVAYSLGIDLVDVARSMNLTTDFAGSYDTIEQGDLFVIKPADVCAYIDSALASSGDNESENPLQPLSESVSELLDGVTDKQSYVLYTNLFIDSPKNRKELFSMGSAFSMQDFRAYLHRLIKDTFPEDSLNEFSKHASIPYDSLLGMLSGEPDKILYADVCQIDKVTLQDGQLASICWKAVECHLGLIRATENNLPLHTWSEEEFAVYEKLMLDYRFFRSTRPEYQNWIEDLQSKSSDNLKQMIEIR